MSFLAQRFFSWYGWFSLCVRESANVQEGWNNSSLTAPPHPPFSLCIVKQEIASEQDQSERPSVGWGAELEERGPDFNVWV